MRRQHSRIATWLSLLLASRHALAQWGQPRGGQSLGGEGAAPNGGEQCSCTEDADPSEARYEESANATSLTIRTAGIPSHTFHHNRDQPNPNPVCVTPVKTTLPRRPQLSGRFKETPFGIIGILKTGGFLYNHLTNQNYVNDVANHPNNEQPSLDACHGHADLNCRYHYHEISKLPECTHDGQWDECELIGFLLDGFPVYSHCFSPNENRYLKSCFLMTNDVDNDNGGDKNDYSVIGSNDCDLDAANGYDFTGKGIQDNRGKKIAGYAYVATDTYPYLMAYYAGAEWYDVSVLEEWPNVTADTLVPTASPTIKELVTSASADVASFAACAVFATLHIVFNL